jgi:hypothetical protein
MSVTLNSSATPRIQGGKWNIFSQARMSTYPLYYTHYTMDIIVLGVGKSMLPRISYITVSPKHALEVDLND